MIKVRFAPSPTGYLHVGNARAALVNYLFARSQGGHLLLRLDDTDTERGRPEYEQGIYDDLRWLGLDWDSTDKQSLRFARYAEVAEALKAAGRLYPCFENEDELAAKRAALVRRKLPPVYDRAALTLTAEQRAAAEAAGKRPYWRFKLSDGAASWIDLVLGSRTVKFGTVSDPVLIRADGTPLYTFTSVVDDVDHEITHIIRGEDHVTNTAVQIDLFAASAADQRWGGRETLQAPGQRFAAGNAQGRHRGAGDHRLFGPARHQQGPGAAEPGGTGGGLQHQRFRPLLPPF
jgi:glutamyl-tRNA synthetase